MFEKFISKREQIWKIIAIYKKIYFKELKHIYININKSNFLREVLRDLFDLSRNKT